MKKFIQIRVEFNTVELEQTREQSGSFIALRKSYHSLAN